MEQQQFQRTEILLGKEAMERLFSSRVAVFGLGGVGGSCAEALARAGIGALDLIDNDEVSVTNINRQIIATFDTVGKKKTEAMKERIASISPACEVRTYDMFFLPENQDTFDFSCYDYVVDAVDTVKAKLALVECANKAGVPIISAMGAGNKLDATAFEVTDISKTSVCPLARVMRTELKKRGIYKLKVVYSKEQPLKPLEDIPKEAGGKLRGTPGSVSFVPPVVGYIMAGEIIRDVSDFSKKSNNKA